MDTTDVNAWLEAQPEETQQAVGMVLILLRTWYGQANEDPDRAAYFLRTSARLSGGEIVRGARVYLHLAHGDYPAHPEQIREFLLRSPKLVVPMLRAMLGKKLDIEFDGGSGRVTRKTLDAVVAGFSLSTIISEERRAAFAKEVDALVERMPFTVVEQAAFDEACRLRASGEVSARHPAHGFVTSLIELAPDTLTLNSRAAELGALIMGALPEE